MNIPSVRFQPVPVKAQAEMTPTHGHPRLNWPAMAKVNTGTQLRTAMHLITRTLNNLSAKMEISAAMAAASLLGLPATVFIHNFWYVFIWPAITAAKSTKLQLETDVSTSQS